MQKWNEYPDNAFFDGGDLHIKVRAKKKKWRKAAKIAEEMFNWYLHAHTAEFFKDCLIAYNIKLAQDNPPREWYGTSIVDPIMKDLRKKQNDSAGGTL